MKTTVILIFVYIYLFFIFFNAEPDLFIPKRNFSFRFYFLHTKRIFVIRRLWCIYGDTEGILSPKVSEFILNRPYCNKYYSVLFILTIV